MTKSSNPNDESQTPAEETTLREELEQWRADLRTLADEVRVKIHLGGLEAKQAWNELEPKLYEFEGKAEQLRDDVGAELKNVGAGLKHVGEDLKHVGKDLKHVGKDLKQAGTTLKGELVRLRDRLVKG